MSKHKVEGVSNGVLDFIGGIQHHPTVTAGS
jgi:predicted nuclease with TOPRIM domain